jgi:hypothetical protein
MSWSGTQAGGAWSPSAEHDNCVIPVFMKACYQHDLFAGSSLKEEIYFTNQSSEILCFVFKEVGFAFLPTCKNEIEAHIFPFALGNRNLRAVVTACSWQLCSCFNVLPIYIVFSSLPWYLL